MFKRTELIKQKNLLKFDSYLGYNHSWFSYYWQYKNVVDMITNSIENDEFPIDTVSLPLLFSIRHCLELGLKANIQILEKINTGVPKISYKGVKAHSISNLYDKFKLHLNIILKENIINDKVKEQIREYLNRFETLKDVFQQLDNFSYNFRYPFDSEGNFSFHHNTRINITSLINLFYDIQPFLLFTSSVLFEEGIDL